VRSTTTSTRATQFDAPATGALDNAPHGDDVEHHDRGAQLNDDVTASGEGGASPQNAGYTLPTKEASPAAYAGSIEPCGNVEHDGDDQHNATTAAHRWSWWSACLVLPRLLLYASADDFDIRPPSA
jgi:hypothetical protein